jgi:hypothetical protein
MTLEEAIALIMALIEPDPEDEGGCCRYCHQWGSLLGTDKIAR